MPISARDRVAALQQPTFDIRHTHDVKTTRPDMHDLTGLDEIHEIRHLTNDEIESLLQDPDSISDEYRSVRRGRPLSTELMIVHGTVNGHYMRVLIDSGCSIRAIVDSKSAEEKNLPRQTLTESVNISLGNNSQDSIQSQCIGLSMSMCGFQFKEKPYVMNLGKFDVILGTPWLKWLESQCTPDSWRVSFIRQELKGQLIRPIKGVREVCISSAIDASVLDKPKFASAYLKGKLLLKGTQTQHNPHELENSLLVMMTSDYQNIIPTVHGDQAITVGTLHKEEQPLRRDADPSSQSNEDIVREGIEKANKNDWKSAKPQPDWNPIGPKDIPKDLPTADPELFTTSELRQNTTEQLEKLKPGLPKFLREYGQAFNDRKYTHDIPDRGRANAKFVFNDPTPRSFKPYRLSPAEMKALAEILRDMLLKGVIRPSDSPWGTPVFLVPKSDGGWRLCCDYRALNKQVVAESYCVPASDVLIDQLATGKVFSTHDMTWGYHQLRWDPDSIPATAIRTHFGTFEFMVMNFGPTNAPAQWQRLVEEVLRPYLYDFVVIYLDDLVVYSKTWEEHEEHLRLVYRLLIANKLHLRLAKCYFYSTKIKFLGWIIEKGTLTSDPEKLKTLKDWPQPESKTEVRSFIGFVNFYRRLIPKCSELLSPLTDLTLDPVPNSGPKFLEHWNAAATQAFEKAKEILCTAPVVRLADPEKPYVLEPDASNVAVGGVLMQEHEGKLHPVAYLSKRLGKAQRSYEPGKLELLALIVSLTAWRHYLLGCKGLKLLTDHEPLLALRSTKNPNRMLLRWMHFIEQFRFEIEHKPGKLHRGDFLSRPRPDESKPGIEVSELDNSDLEYPDLDLKALCTISLPNPYQNDDLESHSTYSTQCGQLYLASLEAAIPSDADSSPDRINHDTIEQLKSATSADDMVRKYQDDPGRFTRSIFLYRGGLFFRNHQGQLQLYIPPALDELRSQLLRDAHYSVTAGHMGQERTFRRLSRYYWWPGMRAQVNKMCKECIVCLRSKRTNLGQPELSPHLVPHENWEVICMDEVSGIPACKGYDAIWVFIDKFSKMAHFVPITKEGFTTESLAETFLTHVYRLHGLPRTIISDRDPRINNEFWRTLFDRLGTKLNVSSSHHPQTDGQSEVMIRTLTDMLRAFVNSNQDDWLQFLPCVEFAYNDSVHPGTGYTPFELNYLKHPRNIQSLLFEQAMLEEPPNSSHQQQARNFLRKRFKIMQEVRSRLQQVAAKMPGPKVRTVKRRTEVYSVGDMVLVHRSLLTDYARQNKLSNIWIGPFKVLGAVGARAYRIDLPPEAIGVNPNIHLEHLKSAPGSAEAYPAYPRGAPLPRLEPLTNRKIAIESMNFNEDEENPGMWHLNASTDHGVYRVLDLCRMGHFPEVEEYLEDGTNFYKHKFQYLLGRFTRYKFDGKDHKGVITAYDRLDPNAQYEVAYADHDSDWIPAMALRLTRKPPKPR